MHRSGVDICTLRFTIVIVNKPGLAGLLPSVARTGHHTEWRQDEWQRRSVSTSGRRTRWSSVLEGGEPTVIPNAEGGRTTPSVVGFAKSGEVLVGEVAKRQAITNPDRTVRSVKRHMGTSWTIDIDGKAYTAQEISAADPAEAEAGRRGVPRRLRHPGRHHRARVLRRRAAHRDERGRPDRRARGAAHHQRADGGRARLRPRQGRCRPDDPRVRPRRWDVRRLDPRDRRRRLRSQVDLGQHPPRW